MCKQNRDAKNTKPEIKTGSTVLVPRTGGYKCLGIIESIMGPVAKVAFPVGPVFRGEDHANPDEWASKTISLDKLKLIRP